MHGGELREAASVILLRPAEDARGFEVLMVARNPAARVLGGMWAFPGGVVEPQDGVGDTARRAAATRELAEETAITGLAPRQLVPFARWITPVSLPARFDAYFFLARAPLRCEPRVDGVECVDAGWLRPADALGLGGLPGRPMVFPTRRMLERMSAFADIQALIDAALSTPVALVTPRLAEPGDADTALLPDDPGYGTARG